MASGQSGGASLTTNHSAQPQEKPWRYRWADDFRDEVLARLLELNEQRHKEEQLSGAAAEPKPKKKNVSKKKASTKKTAIKKEQAESSQSELF